MNPSGQENETGRRGPGRMLMRLLQVGLPVAVLTIGGLGVAQLVSSAPEAPQRTARERSYSATVQQVAITSAQPQLRLFGELVVTREVELRSLVAGEIAFVNDKLLAGGRVAAGETLIRIDDFPYQGALSEARANLAEAEAGLMEARARVKSEQDALSRAEEQRDLARNELDRAERLSSNGTVSTATVEASRLTLSQREQAVELRQNNLAVEEARIAALTASLDRLAWRVSEAERNLADTVLAAPFDAIVEEAPVEMGKVVSANDMVAKLYDPSSLEAAFTLTDAQYGRILAAEGTLAGRPVSVEWQLGQSTLTLEGEVVRTAPRVNAQSGGVRLFARLQSGEDISYRPGAFVTVRMPDQRYDNVIALPEAAVYNTDTVYLIDGESRLRARTVEVAAVEGTTMYVRGEIPDGARVLVSRISEAGEGVLVDVPGAGNGRDEGIPVADRGRNGPAGEAARVRRQ